MKNVLIVWLKKNLNVQNFPSFEFAIFFYSCITWTCTWICINSKKLLSIDYCFWFIVRLLYFFFVKSNLYFYFFILLMFFSFREVRWVFYTWILLFCSFKILKLLSKILWRKFCRLASRFCVLDHFNSLIIYRLIANLYVLHLKNAFLVNSIFKNIANKK